MVSRKDGNKPTCGKWNFDQGNHSHPSGYRYPLHFKLKFSMEL